MRFKLNLQQFGGQGVLGFGSGVEHTYNNKTYNINVTGTGANWNLDDSELRLLMEKIVDTGRKLTDAELQAYIREAELLDPNNNIQSSGAFENVKEAMEAMISNNTSVLGWDAEGNRYDENGTLIQGEGLTPVGTEPGSVNVAEDQIGAFNAYYNDIYSLQPGTSGAEMLSRLEQSYTNQAQQQAMLADAGFQQAALQQAQTVKQITDQVRSERMARLRAGMSESQIANQDMQMLLTNVNTLNQNAQMLNQQRLQAQTGINTAQDLAYTDFLNQSNARGQVGAAMAASDAGDVYQQTIRQMSTLYGNDPSKWTASQWQQVTERVQGTANTK